MQGKIIKGIAGFYYIYAENDEIYECKAKGIFRKDKQKPLVGDNVEIEVLDEQEKEGSVTAILPRKNSLIRPAVANVDQALVVFAAAKPDRTAGFRISSLKQVSTIGLIIKLSFIFCTNNSFLRQNSEIPKSHYRITLLYHISIKVEAPI